MMIVPIEWVFRTKVRARLNDEFLRGIPNITRVEMSSVETEGATSLMVSLYQGEIAHGYVIRGN